MSRVKVHGTADITLAEAERRQAWRELIAAMGRGRPTPEQARKSPEEQEGEIYEIVEEFRHRRA